MADIENIDWDNIPTRMDLHKQLGTYHFDHTNTNQDYEYFGRIEMPDEWWAEALAEVTNKVDAVPLTGEVVLKAFADQATNIVDVGQASLIKEVRNPNYNKQDSWFDRYMVGDTDMLYRLNEVLKMDHPSCRIAAQHSFEQVAMHIDHEHTQIISHYKSNDEKKSTDMMASVADRGPAKKFLIAMHDSEPGMLMAWGNSTFPAWKRGDIFSWKYGVPHWTTNFSETTRYLVGFIGDIDRQDYIDRFNYDYEDTSAYPTPITVTL